MPIPEVVRDLRRTAQVTVHHGLLIPSRAGADDTEYWHDVGTAGEVGFQNNWGNYGAGRAPVGFRMDASGFVHLRGVAHGAPAQGGVIFTLPASWRPPGLQTFTTRFAELTSLEQEVLYVRSNGEVTLRWPTPGNFNRSGLLLDNYRWRAG
jgi:hypothetical protein